MKRYYPSDNPETIRRRRQYRRLRRQLVLDMGGYCAYCTTRLGLEFHHTKPRTWIARKTSRLQRIRLYRRDWERGDLDLACGECNKILGDGYDAIPNDF